MNIKYVDILTGKNLLLVKIANMDLIFWLVRSSNKRGGDRVEGG